MNNITRILIVEDLPPDYELAQREIRKTLKQCKFERAVKQRDFLRALEDFQPDLIVSDYVLPDFDGMKVLKLVQKHSPSTPVIIWTGAMGESVVVECLKQGAANYVIKDDTQRLGLAVRRALEERGLALESRRVEEKYRLIFENAMEGIFQSTPDGRYLSVNPAMAQIYGYSSTAEMIESITDIPTQVYAEPETRIRFIELLQRDGIVRNFEMKNLRKDGSVIWTSTSARIVRDEYGNVLYYEGFLQDITERRETADKLRESEAKYRLLFEGNALPMWIYDLETLAFLKVNDAAVEHYGYSEAEFLSMTIKDIRPAADVAALLASISNDSQGIDRAGIWRHCKKDGTLILVDIIAHPVEFAGRKSELVLAIDVTRRVQIENAEREQRAMTEALRQTAETLSRTLDYGEVLDQILATVGTVVPSDAATIMLIDQGKVHVVRSRGYQERGFPANVNELELSLVETPNLWQIIETGKPFIVPNTKTFPGWKRLPATDWIGSNAGAPICVGGEVIGFILLDSETPGFFTPLHAKRLEAFANQAALAIHNSRLLQQAQEEIAARNRIEAALRESEEQFRLITQNAEDVIWTMNMNFQITYASPSLERMLGYTVQEIMASSPERFLTPESYALGLQVFREEIENALPEPDPNYARLLELECLHKDGSVLWVETKFSFFRDAQGYPTAVLGVSRDITARREAEAHIKDLLEFNEKILNHSPLGILTYKSTGECVFANRNAASMIGADVERLKQQNFHAISSWKESGLYELVNRVISTRSTLTDDIFLRSTFGKELWLRVHLVPFKSKEEDHILLTISDITDRKLAENRLRESESRLILALSAAQMSVWDWDLESDRVLWSPEFYAITGIQESAFDGTFESYVSFIHPQDAVRVREAAQKAVAADTLFAEEFRIIRPNGEVRWLSNLGHAEYGPSRTSLRMIGTVQDITERKQVEIERQALLEITQGLAGTEDLQEFLALIHRSIGNVIFAENFFVVFHNKDSGLFEEIYSVDQYDPPAPPSTLEKSITSYVFRTGEPLLVDQKLFDELAARGEVELVGTNSPSWMGVPLKTVNETIGLIAVQDYENPNRYSEHDRNFLASIANQVAVALERKRVEEKVRESEGRFRALFESSPVSLWEEDFSGVKKHLDSLKDQGVTDFRAYLAAHPEVVIECNKMIGVLDVNNAGLQMYRANSKKELLESTIQTTCPGEQDHNIEDFVAIAEGKTSHGWEGADETLTGEPLEINLRWSVAPGHEQDFSRVIVTVIDITGRKQAEQEIRKQTETRLALYETTQDLVIERDLSKLLNIIVERMARLLNCGGGGLYLCEPELNQVRCVVSYNTPKDFTGTTLKYGEGAAGIVAQTAEPLIIDDYYTWSGRANVYNSERYFNAVLSVPIKWQNQVIGVIHALAYDERRFNEDDLNLIMSFANQAAIALQNARLHSGLEQKNRIHLALEEATLPLIKQLDISEALQTITARAAQLLNTMHGYIYLITPENNEIELMTGMGKFTDYIGRKLKPGEGIAGKVWQTGEPLIIRDYHIWPGRSSQFEETEFRSVIGVPLISGSRVMGVLGLANLQPDQAYDNDSLELLKRFAQLASIALENARLYTLSQQELAERKRIAEALQAAQEKYRRLVEQIPAAIYIDIGDDWGTKTYISPQIEKISGYAAEAWTVDPLLWSRILYPDDREHVLTENIRTNRTGEVFNIEYRIIKANGQIAWVQENAVLLESADGETSIWHGMITDITNRKRVEEALQASENKAKALLNALPDMMFRMDREGTFLDYKAEPSELYAQSQPTLIGRKNRDISPLEFADLVDRQIQKTLESGEMQVFEYLLQVPGRGLLDFEARMVVSGSDEVTAVVRDITERKQAEEKLRASEERYHGLFQNLVDGFALHEIITDEQGRPVDYVFIEINPAFEKLAGLSAGDVIGRRVTEVLPGIENERFIPIYGKVALTGEPILFEEYSAPLKKYFEINAYSPKIYQFAVTFVDITERKQAELALLQSQARYHDLFDSSPISLWEEDYSLVKQQIDIWLESGITDLKQYLAGKPERVRELASLVKVTDVNQATLELFHARQKDELLKDLGQLLDEEDIGGFPLEILGFMSPLKRFEREGSKRTFDGTQMEVIANGSIAQGYEQDWSKVIVSVRDITERNRTERALRDSEERFSNAFEFAPIGKALVSPTGNWLKVNLAMCTMVGYSRDELLRKTFQDITHPDDLEADLSRVQQMLAGEINFYQMEKRYLHKSGSIVWALLSVSLVRNSEGMPQYFISQVQDITQRKLAEEEISRRIKETSALLETSLALTNLDLKAILQSVGNSAKSLFAADGCRIFLMQPDGEFLRCVLALQEDAGAFSELTLKLGEGVTGAVALSGQAEIVNEMQNDPRAVQVPGTQEEEEALMFAPLKERGRAIGVISIRRTGNQRLFVPSDLGLLEAFASMAASAVSNARLFEEAQRRLAELEALYENGLAVGQLLEPRQIGERIIETFGRHLSWHHVAIRLKDPESDGLQLIAFSQMGLSEREKLERERHFSQMVSRTDQGLSGWVIQTGAPLRTGNVHAHPQYVDTQEGIESGLYMPLKIGGRVIGVISVESEKKDAFSAQDERLLATLANQASIAFENARLYQAAQQEITERELIEQELRQSQERYRLLIETSPDGIIMMNMDGAIRFSNLQMAGLFGFDGPTELLGTSLSSLFSQEELTQTEQDLGRYLLNDTSREGHWLIRKDGSRFFGELRSSSLRNENSEEYAMIVQVRDVTERKQSQEALREERQRFLDLFENSPIPTWLEDFTAVVAWMEELRTQGVKNLAAYLAENSDEYKVGVGLIRVLNVNHAAVIMNGARNKQQLLSMLPELMLDDVPSQVLIQEFDMIWQGNMSFGFEMSSTRLDGSIVTGILHVYIPENNGRSDYARVIVTSTDISDRVEMERKLRASELHYRELADSISDVLFELDHSLRFTHWNKASEMLMGIPAREAIGKSMYDIFGMFEEQIRIGVIYQEVLATNQAKTFETEIVLQEHKLVFEINAYPSTRGVSVVARNITERKLTETLMHTRFELVEYAASHSFEEVLQRTIDVASNLTESHIGFLNFIEDDQTTIRLQAWSTETLRDFCRVEGAGMHLPVEKAGVWADALRQRKSIIHNDYESLVNRKGMPEGHAKVIREMVIPIIRNEKTVAVMGVGNKSGDYTRQDIEIAERFADYAWDIAERKQMENTLAEERNQLARRVEERTADLSRANANLARALRVKDEFLANMSHELRTPLNAILGLSESLGEQVAGPLNEKQQKYLSTINESGHHLLALINDILDLAKIEAGQITLDINKVDVNSVCQASLRMIIQLAQKKNQEVIFEIDPDLGLMWADERRLKQMIVNLLSNAVKFTPENSGIGLEVHGDRAANKVVITVWDTGIGIRAEDLDRLFKPFVQLDAGLAREASGTGLGLALVAQMARLHGGSVHALSQPGQGSRFIIQLPWEPAMAGDMVALLRNTGKFRAIDPNASRPTILLIEDTREVVMMLVDYLEMAGYNMVTAQDGIDGLEQAKLTRPDLILMDIQMPRMDGFETTQKLRSDPAFRDIPIIALTALAMPNDRQRCLDAGMDEYISKPVNLKALTKTIHKLLSPEANPS